MKSPHLFALISTLSVFGCGIFGLGDCNVEPTTIPQPQPEKLTIQEGFWGQISFREGSFSPSSPELRCTAPNPGTIEPVQRWVLVYEPTTGSMSTSSDVHSDLLDSVSTAVVDSVWSDASGFFEIVVPPGEYSIFVREDGFLHATLGGGNNLWFPGVVTPGQVTELEIQIRYKSVS